MTLEAGSQHVSRPRRVFALPPAALLVTYGAAVTVPLALASLSAEREEVFWRTLAVLARGQGPVDPYQEIPKVAATLEVVAPPTCLSSVRRTNKEEKS
jgi:hypothetical protein